MKQTRAKWSAVVLYNMEKNMKCFHGETDIPLIMPHESSH